MFEGEFAVVSRLAVIFVVGGCLVFQKYLRRHVSREQYDYVRDIMLLCAWVLVALWSGSETAREVVATALLACVAGVVNSRSKHFPGRILLSGSSSLSGGKESLSWECPKGSISFFIPWFLTFLPLYG